MLDVLRIKLTWIIHLTRQLRPLLKPSLWRAFCKPINTHKNKASRRLVGDSESTTNLVE